MSTRSDMMAQTSARLSTIKAANGYATDVKKVYSDEIPMGVSLNDYELPAIFLLDAPDKPGTEFKVFKGEWIWALQLWHSKVPDSTMLTFVRDVYKAIFADSPVAQREDAFRSIHPKLVEIVPLSIVPDLNMIEANRVYEVSFLVRYRTELWNL